MGKEYYERAVELLEQVVRVDEEKLPPTNRDQLRSQQRLEDVTRLVQVERDAGSYSEGAMDTSA